MSDRTTENPGRRRFFERILHSIQTVIGGTLAVITGGAILGPSFLRRQTTWLNAGSVSALADNEATPVTVRVARQDGYTETVDRQVVFLVKSPGGIKALSSICTHLGCRVSWDADAKLFKCPCHGGVYDKTGAVVSGPPPAPLTSLMTRVDGDDIFVQA